MTMVLMTIKGTAEGKDVSISESWLFVKYDARHKIE